MKNEARERYDFTAGLRALVWVRVHTFALLIISFLGEA